MALVSLEIAAIRALTSRDNTFPTTGGELMGKRYQQQRRNCLTHIPGSLPGTGAQPYLYLEGVSTSTELARISYRIQCCNSEGINILSMALGVGNYPFYVPKDECSFKLSFTRLSVTFHSVRTELNFVSILKLFFPWECKLCDLTHWHALGSIVLACGMYRIYLFN